MIAKNDFLIPDWPEALQHVDIARVRFVLLFSSSSVVQPSDFLGIGRALQLAGRPLPGSSDKQEHRQWETLFRPPLSGDPVARRKFQKPAPAFVLTMPLMQQSLFNVGDKLVLEALFIGTGIPLIHSFLRSLIHLGNLGLVAGAGRFEVTQAFSLDSDCKEHLVWRQNEALESLACSVQSLPWLFQKERISHDLSINYLTPARLMVDGKPLRRPSLMQVFPFMLRRVTSMLYAHSDAEVCDDPAHLLEKVLELEQTGSKLAWRDWRSLEGQRGMSVGGFIGEMSLHGQALEDLYWVFAVASLFGVGKGATYGAGRFSLSSG